MSPVRMLMAGPALALALSGPAIAADLTVSLSGTRSADGQVRLMLFDREDGFRKEDKARAVLPLPAAAGALKGVFRHLPPGRYAVVAYHDENGDGKLNLRFGMFPKEGYGLSNNPAIVGPPRFKDAAFDVPLEGGRLEIRLTY